MLTYLLLLALEGLLVGAFARLALPGRDPLSLLQTMAVGLGGVFTAGLITYALTDGDRAPGFVVSLVFATLIVYAIRRSRGGGLLKPRDARDRDRSPEPR